MQKKSFFFITLCILLTISLFIFVSLNEKEIELIILHTNDIHSRVESGEYAGMGFAKMSTIIKEQREKNPDLLLLDAGDAFHGLVLANLVKGDSIVELFNEIGYDAVVPGNHDFNYGKDRLKELAEVAEFSFLAANIIYEDENRKFLEDYIIKEYNGVNIGIFGLSTPETAYKTHPGNIDGLVFMDPILAAKEIIYELKDSVDIIIALTHLGLDDSSEYTSEILAREVPEIDIIIDGHSHHVLREGLKNNNTLIAMAGEYNKYIGLIKIVVDEGNIKETESKLISKEESSNTKEDPEILNLIEEIKKKNREIASRVIGETTIELDGRRESIRKGETNLANLITDAIKDVSSIDGVILHSGAIRDSINAGEIRKEDIINVLPFGNFIVVKELSGSQILNVIEHGISSYPDEDGRFPQVSGISYSFDSTRPAGERLVGLEINDKRIDLDKKYLIAINDFMALGGDGYTMLRNTNTIREAGAIEEILIKYIEKKGVVSPKIEGRINEVNKTAKYHLYEVQPGDSLSQISIEYNVLLSYLLYINKLEDPDTIYVNQELLVPLE